MLYFECMKKTIIFLLITLLCVLNIASQSLPELTGRVLDIPGLLKDTEKSELEKFLTNYETATKHQLVIAIINTTGELSLEEYSIKLAEKWKIGSKEKDDGIIILIAMQDRKIRIEVGYGLEGDVTDLQSNRIIRNIIAPNFKNNDFYRGLKGAVYKIAELTGGKVLVEGNNDSSSSYEKKSQKNSVLPISGGTVFIFIIIMIIFFIINIFRRIGNYTIGGGSHRGGFGGFGSGGFGGFGSSGGGFSGGGGSFGGGGSSGSW
jgi:uncharacterized protein